MTRRIAAALALVLAAAPAAAQSTLETSPNIAGTWTVRSGTATFVFAHRFVSLHGGDEIQNFPTLTLAFGLPHGFTVGADHTSNSEIDPANLNGNETDYWVKRAFILRPGTVVAPIAAYNAEAHSADGAISLNQRLGPLTLLAEGRGYSDMFHTGDAGFAGTVGGVFHINRYLGLTGDVGRVLSSDTFGTVWSGGVALAIPGSPHTLSFHASNAGATTLQGASHRRALFTDKIRYGFTFTVPLGGPARWLQIIHPRPAPLPADSASAPAATAAAAAAAVLMRGYAFRAPEVHVRAGQSVRWTNEDDDEHTVTAKDGAWNSGLIGQHGSYVHRFDAPGRYEYYCIPHPDMVGVVIVE